MAEDQRQPIPLRHPVDLLVDHEPQFRTFLVLLLPPRPCVGGLPFDDAPPCGLRALLLGDPEGDSVEPVGQQLAIAERRGLLDEDEERGLERIFRRVLVTQDPAARSQDQRTVTVNQDS